MRQRVVTAVVLAPFAIAAVLLMPSPLFVALVAAILLLGLWEWTRLSGVRDRPLRAVILAAHAALLAWLAWRGWPGLFPWLALLGVAWWVLAVAWMRQFAFASQDNARNRVIKLAAGTLAIVPAWAGFALLHADGEFGPRWTLFAVALVWAADTFAYFSGRRFGDRKLAPRISPAKTWAGLWGGLVGAALLALAAAPLLGVGWSGVPALVLATLLAAVASVVGDLFESLIKRHCGAKDSGVMFPGHGGILDRLDSVLAAIPVFVVAKDLLGL